MRDRTIVVEDALSADLDYLRRKWRENVTDASTGVDMPTVGRVFDTSVPKWKMTMSWQAVKAKMLGYLCDNISIGVSRHDWFPAFAYWSRDEVRGEGRIRQLHPVLDVLRKRDREVTSSRTPNLRCYERGGWVSYHDFDHSAPWWEDALAIGFPGMLSRLEANWKDDDFHRVRKSAAESILRLLDRLAGKASEVLEETTDVVGKARLEKVHSSLRRLRVGAPQTALDALNFIYLYWVISEVFENVQVRTLGNLDRLLMPYYRADLAEGRSTEAEFRDQLKHFWWQWGSMDYYWGQPVFVGGTEADGSTCYNELSRIILDVHDELSLPTPKLHLKIGKSTPEWVWTKALDMARRQRSVTFCGEEPHWRVIRSMGYTQEQAREFILWGCYEWAIRDSANDTCGAVLNLLKPIEKILSESSMGVISAPTFDDFLGIYEDRLVKFVATVRNCVQENQRGMEEINPTMLYTLATPYSIGIGRDAFAEGGVEHGNNTGIWTVGLGTTVDALLAVKEIVYEKKIMTLSALGQLMAEDWRGREDLRLRMLRSKRKWGNNDLEANALGRRVSKCVAGEINGRPNSRGGVFKASGHSARNHIGFGRDLGATPDGRRKGEEFSKNISPTMGVDTEGATALLDAVANLDACDLPGDFPLDVALLPATVSGEKGIRVLRALIEQYFADGGLVIQFNVHDAATLRDAQKQPLKYPNLQVRVCGWNIRWNDMPRAEQDAFIRRAENLPCE